MYISGICIKGFKKYLDYNVKFKKHLNILIGENEAGKSTILDAIEVVLNQKYFFNNQNGNAVFFSKENIKKFNDSKNIDSLPKIELEIFLGNQGNITPEMGRFRGEHNFYAKNLFGIHFEYKFNESFSDLFENFETKPIIPIDYYKAEWRTFSGATYNRKLNPLKSLMIDNSISRYGVYDNFAKDLYETTYSENKRSSISYDFRVAIKGFLDDKSKDLVLDNEQNFSISEEKANIKSLLTVEHKGVVLQQKGKGMENILKTQQALKNSQSKLLLIEEPENHLSPMNLRKLIGDISTENSDSQIILATHESLIVNRLGLDKLIWLERVKPSSFENLDDATIDYFSKIDHTNVLQFILADKVILVEGAAEYILIDKLFNAYNNTSGGLDDHKIEIISCGGITYERYLDVAKDLNKPILVLTDNDRKQDRIDKVKVTNEKYEASRKTIRIELEKDVNNFTFEVSLFNKNREILKNLARANASTIYNDKEYDRNLAFMLNNKTKAAMRIEKEIKTNDLICPDYISRGFEWLKNF
ncbi:ATP-dependent nuclease [Lactococcus lactis]|uniref:ATP-dependent nuclease n=1 Tax=Lactococcus lactis TaxID=1358 RepID=UPI000B0DBC74|nr:AAA family ATPase [Lactococcus lactis]